jgi:hypothetical protein
MKSSLLKKASQITSSTGHNIVVVKEAAPEAGPDSDPELQRLKVSVEEACHINQGYIRLVCLWDFN